MLVRNCFLLKNFDTMEIDMNNYEPICEFTNEFIDTLTEGEDQCLVRVIELVKEDKRERAWDVFDILQRLRVLSGHYHLAGMELELESLNTLVSKLHPMCMKRNEEILVEVSKLVHACTNLRKLVHEVKSMEPPNVSDLHTMKEPV